METPIGQGLRSGGLWTTTVVSAAVVCSDVALVAARRTTPDLRHALAAGVIVLFGLVALFTRDRASFGFRLSPLQGWAYWGKMTVWLGIAMLLILLAAAAIVLGILRYPIPPIPLAHLSDCVSTCVDFPLFEEIIYRLALCIPIAAWLGPRAAIAVSGFTFAGLHVLYGNPSFDNLLGGFILAWAFLKSGSLLVPIALHSLGNLCAFLFHLAYFYLHA